MTRSSNSDARYYFRGLLIVLAYLLPSIISGESHFVLIHDFLDSTVAHMKSMKDSGALFDFSKTMPILSGIPRYVYGSPADIKLWLFILLPPYWATLANIFLIKFTAFAGLFALLRRYILPIGEKSAAAAFVASALFALVPFYPDYGVSSAGIPMLAWAFLNLWDGRKVGVSLLLFVYYALFSWIVLSGVFVCFVAAILILLQWIGARRFPLLPFLGLCVLTAALVGANWQMFVGYFTPSEPSHRSEFALMSFNLKDLALELSVLLVSQYHAGTCAAALIAVVFVIEWRRHRDDDRWLDLVFIVFVVEAALIVLGSVGKLTLTFIPFLREFQIDRFFFLYPAVCYIMMGAVAYELIKKGRRGTLGALSAVVLLAGLCFDQHITGNLGRLTGIEPAPGFAQYYDTPLFEEIKSDLGIRDFEDKVVCLGFNQAVCEYYEIYTADGYIQMYPLSYKHRFQKVIQGELDKSEDLRSYFCDWGERCYLFSAELGQKYAWGKDCGKTVEHLDIDVQALSELGCKYIFSAVPICNWQELGLGCEGSWTHDDSYWEISVYRVNQE